MSTDGVTPGVDDLGTAYDGPVPAARVVSLVPSVTEAIAASRPGALVGCTDFCTHPADLDAHGVRRVRGTKNPDRAAIAALAPDVVVTVREENRELDVRRLRAAGVRVWTCDITTVTGALDSLDRLWAALGWDAPAWSVAARAAWDRPLPPVTHRVAVPVWRDPWLVVGPDTFTADLLRRRGAEVAAPAGAGRYPRVEQHEVDRGADLVLLPDEPYAFGPHDGPEAFPATPTRLVSGRLLTWYGPSLVEAADGLSGLLT